MLINNFLRFNISKNKLIPQYKCPNRRFLQHNKQKKNFLFAHLMLLHQNMLCKSVKKKSNKISNGNIFCYALHTGGECPQAGTKNLPSPLMNTNNFYTQKLNIEFKQFLKNYKYEKLLNNYKEFNNLPNDFTTNKLPNPYFANTSQVLGCANNTTQNKDFVACPSASTSALQNSSTTESQSDQNFYKNYVYGFQNLTKEKQQKLKLETGFSNPSIFCTLAQAKLLKKASKPILISPNAKNKTKVVDPGYFSIQYASHNGVNTLKNPLLYWALYNKTLPNNLIHPRHLRAFFKKPSKTQQKAKNNSFLFQTSGATPKYGKHNFITNVYISPKPTYCFLQIILEKYLETPNNCLNDRIIINKLPSSINIHLNSYYASHTGGICPQVASLASMQIPSPSKSPNKIEPYVSPVYFSNQQNTDGSTSDYAVQILAKQQQKINMNIKVDCSQWKLLAISHQKRCYASHEAYSLKLFKKISNKTILTYWLIPVAGFAFISGNITMLSRSFNNLQIDYAKHTGGECPQESPSYTPYALGFFYKEKQAMLRMFLPNGKNKHQTGGVCPQVDSSMKYHTTNSPITLRPHQILSTRHRAYSFDTKETKINFTKQNFATAKTHLNPITRFCLADKPSNHSFAELYSAYWGQMPNTIQNHEIASNKLPKPYFTEWMLRRMHRLQNQNNNWHVSPLYSNQTVKNNLNFIKKKNVIFEQSLKLLKSKLIKLAKADNYKKTWLNLPSYACQNPKASLQNMSVTHTGGVGPQEVLSDNQLYTPFTSYNQGLNNVCQFFKNPACSVADFKSKFKTAIEINKSQKPYYILLSKLTNLMPNFINNLDALASDRALHDLDNLPITTFGFADWQTMQKHPKDKATTYFKNHLQAKVAKTKTLPYLDNKTKLLSNYFDNYCQLSKDIKRTRFAPESALAVDQNHSKHVNLSSLSKKQKTLQNQLSRRVDYAKHTGGECPQENLLSKPLKLKLNLMQVLPNAGMQNGFGLKIASSKQSSPFYFSILENPAHCAEEHKKVKKGSSYFTKQLLVTKQTKTRANPFLNSLSVLLSQEKMFKNNYEKQAKLHTRGVSPQPESINAHILKKLSIQKKRKAKKQRLETRRQKKRIRFFPRPVWLRYRMFLNLLNQRLIRYDNAILSLKHDFAKQNHEKRSLTDNKLVINYNQSHTFRDSYSAQKSSKYSKTQLKKIVYLLNKGYQKSFKNAFEKIDYLLYKKTHLRMILLDSKTQGSFKIQRYLKTKNFNISNSKIKANYSNFNNEKKNNSPPTNNLKTNNQNTVLRDFWISAYNNTLTKTYIPLNWFLPTKQSNQMVVKSIKNAYNKSRNALRINWGLKKTNTNSITPYNKRYLLWGTQKLRNQSKNNKTKFFEKKFITNWDHFFLNKNYSNFYKKIHNKYIHTNQKLIYITNPNFLEASAPSMRSITDTSSPHINNKVPHGLMQSILYTKVSRFKTQNLVFKTKDIKFFNAQHIPDDALPIVNSWKTTSFFNLTNWQNQTYLPSLKHFLTTKKNLSALHNIEQHYLILGSCIFLHLCALISLVTISQVRCFSKFHLILLYKLSNFYNSLIQKISNLIPGYFSIQDASHKRKHVTLSSAKLPLKQFELNSNLETNASLANWQNQATYAKNDYKATQILSFSFNLLKKEHKRIYKSNISSNVVFKNRNSIKLCPKSKLIAKPTPGSASYKLSTKDENSNLDAANVLTPSKQKHKMLLTKVNIVSRKSLFLKYLLSLGWTLKLSLKTGMLPTMQKQLFKFNDNHLLQKQNRVYHINQKLFYLNKNKIFLVKAFKEKTAFISFNLINMFQKSVRTVSNFFEKPAEFTTTWIAFGFLIEWSSDLINVIPENIDIFVWDSFYKLTRVIPIQFFFYFNSGTMLLLLNKYGLNTTTIFHPLNKLTWGHAPPVGEALQNSLLLKTSNILISHLFYRRILHLIDAFIETISQPDTDLISRQEKGTLFWDIWADFLVTAADYYNVNIAALSTIKAEQNLLIKKISNNFDIDFQFSGFVEPTYGSLSDSAKQKQKKLDIFMDQCDATASDSAKHNHKQIILNKIINSCLVGPGSTLQKLSSMHSVNSISGNQSNDRWSINQFVTYQSCKNLNTSNGDLFIDFHSPKSFAHIPTIKYNKILQQPIGMLVCQIYSGIFSKQISKNLLLVNMGNSVEPSSDYNIQLIQALAGETELKIIRDNAQRYALVNRGFAIGIKLLKDVFFAIALNTPCIFLLEDLHAIGERRPMLLSDYGSSPGSNTERDEVHEKNQVVYQLTRHSIAHYKKPFKGDYSLAIPTNLYSLDLFLKQPSQSTSNLSLIVNHNLTLKNKIKIRSQNNKKAPVQTNHHSLTKKYKTNKVNSTSLTPPSTSPFSVLLLKEEKKLKQNKIVEEIAWTGVSVSSLGLQDFQRDSGKHDETKPRTSYSVRAKVSMLAELSLSNISAKLDMITDLLVIIDSVRSNKGFVVFATTNMPHILDPALRRPGRFDETICLPNINTKNHYYVPHTGSKSIQASHSTFLPSVAKALPIQPFFLNRKSNTNSFGYASHTVYKSIQAVNLALVNQKQFLSLTVNTKDYNTILRIKTPHNLTLNNALISYSKKIKQKTKNLYAKHTGGEYPQDFTVCKQKGQRQLFNKKLQLQKQDKISIAKTPKRESAKQTQYAVHNQGIDKLNNLKLLNCKAIAYHEVGKIMLQYYLTRKHFSNGKSQAIFIASNQTQLNLKSLNYLSLYGLKNKFLLQLMLLFGGKVALLLAQKSKLISNNNILTNKKNSSFSLVNKPYNLYTKKILDSEIFENNENLKLATSLMLFFIHKRYLYLKNLIVPQLLSFTEGTLFEEPAGPPFSNLLIPAKRFENYKRVFRDSFVGDNMGQRTSQIPLLEKQQYHTQVNKIKLLNTKQHKIAPNLIENGYNNMSNYVQTPTTINWYYQNLLLKRHGQYLTNQWFNGQLSEHNTETVFLSDIDWRSSFIKQKHTNVRQLKNVYTLLKQKKGYSDTNFLRKSNSVSKSQDRAEHDLMREHQDLNQNGLDILLDFPDTDQYYNPRRRRWLLNKGYWSFWFNLDKVYSEEIIKTWLLESIIQTYTYLYNNTELLDFITSKFIILGYPNYTHFNLNQKQNLTLNSNFELSTVKEIIVTNSFKRF